MQTPWIKSLIVTTIILVPFLPGCTDNTNPGPGGGPSSGTAGSTSPSRGAIDANQGAGSGSTSVY